jgi:hypothetical protein
MNLRLIIDAFHLLKKPLLLCRPSRPIKKPSTSSKKGKCLYSLNLFASARKLSVIEHIVPLRILKTSRETFGMFFA